jgi:hypothetical protein
MLCCLSVCLVYIFICERLWKRCLSPIAYHLNVYQVRGMSSFSCWLLCFVVCLSVCLLCFFTCESLWKSCLSPIAYRLKMFLSVCLSFMLFHLWETLKKLPIAYRLSPQRIPSERNMLINILAYLCMRIHKLASITLRLASAQTAVLVHAYTSACINHSS